MGTYRGGRDAGAAQPVRPEGLVAGDDGIEVYMIEFPRLD